MSSTTVTPMFKGATYDKLKFLAQIVLPALAVLYTTLAGLWGFPEVVKVVGTITAFDTLLGVLLGISQSQFQKAGLASPTPAGVIKIADAGDKRMITLDMEKHPDVSLSDEKAVSFQIDRSQVDDDGPTPKTDKVFGNS